jgi:hypothetical protein
VLLHHVHLLALGNPVDSRALFGTPAEQRADVLVCRRAAASVDVELRADVGVSEGTTPQRARTHTASHTRAHLAHGPPRLLAACLHLHDDLCAALLTTVPAPPNSLCIK